MAAGKIPISLLAVWLVGMLLFASASCAANSEKLLNDPRSVKRVVVLHSGTLDLPATEMTEKGIREVFSRDSDFRIEVFSEYLDLYRFRDVGQRKVLASHLQHRYGAGKIDLIIGASIPAALFLLENGEAVFPGIPLIMCNIPYTLFERINTSPLRAGITGVFDPENAPGMVQSAITLFPTAKHAVLISGSFEHDRMRTIDFRKAIEANGKLQLIDMTELSIEELLERSKVLPKDSIIFYSSFYVDSLGRSFVPRDVLRTLSNTSGIPVFGQVESYMGYGIVGGSLISQALQGKRAAEIALLSLHGRPPGALPFDDRTNTTVTAYDWRLLKQWNISADRLPAGSRVLYRELTVWDQYGPFIVGIILLFCAESTLIVALVVNLKRRNKAETALHESRQELKALAGRLISSQEEERSRLAREFHDDIAQRLAGVAIETGTLQLQLENSGSPLHGLGHINGQLIKLAEDVHGISRQLHPSAVKDLGLERAVDSQCVRFSERENVAVTLHAHGVPEELSYEPALCIYRIIQEALRNIAKHSNAENVEISLRGSNSQISLTIGDDGRGFDVESARHTPGIGLASMRERVQTVSGTFRVSSEPGHGTLVEVTVPIGESS